MRSGPPPKEFPPEVRRRGPLRFTLTSSQPVGLSPRESFVFFEDPGNLAFITPPWLAFRMRGAGGGAAVREGAEFDYTFRWLGLPLSWRSRITEYVPGERFTDVQLKGPYRSWTHRHLFFEVPGGTLVVDEVDYALRPAAALLGGVVGRQLIGIFSYRAARIAEWAQSRPA